MHKLLLSLVLVVALFSCCEKTGPDLPYKPGTNPLVKGDTVSRTLLVYLMAENTLTDFLRDDYDEIKLAALGLADDVRLFVYFDNSDATRLPALYQYHPSKGELLENEIYTFEKDVCSSDTAILGKVLDVIFTDYPTKAFDLILGSHADGWKRHHAKSAPDRIIGIDNGKNNKYSNTITTTIEMEELAALLEQQPVKVDRLMFDACLMQGVEVAYALRNSANWIIASPAEIPAYGAPYDKVVPEFFNPDSNVEDIMLEYKNAYDSESDAVVLSAVHASCMQELADSTRHYVNKYFYLGSENDFSKSLAYVPGRAPAYYDINPIMKNTLDSLEYVRWKAVFDKAVPHIMVSNSRKVYSAIAPAIVTVTDDYGAVSAYFPQNRYANNGLNEDFRTTEWYRAAGWDVAGW